MRVIIAADARRATHLADELARFGIEVAEVTRAGAIDTAAGSEGARPPTDIDWVVLQASPSTLTHACVSWCDRAGARILALCADPADRRLVAAFGLSDALDLGTDATSIVAALNAPLALSQASPGRVRLPGIVAVWGAHGAPGRSMLATELALELSRGGRHIALVDADTHAPSLALALGLSDEAPGLAAACRQAEFGGLDIAELERVSTSVGGSDGRLDVLTGINRPSRWPEISASRLSQVLQASRFWADHTVIDVAASLERDEEIVSDLHEGPRRNAATLTSLAAADLVVAVLSADPSGVARFLRAYSELRATIGTTRVLVIANRLRPGALGVDARGQIRRTLQRFAGIDEVWFVPEDARAADAAMLASRAIGDLSPRSAITLALRRFTGEAVLTNSLPVAAPSRSAQRRVSRRAVAARG
ncbi:MinD-like ATPase involved in chromosome partitioning or flagellar assembly [Microbacterium halimionae]|uniref:MinD-like ATPase involved in chromosome partitioning or flagellar assembly n=1 Tax=Microbacterium halimionae TaxID=1526413 RepID=A0A7W3PLI9_9MICO|nr:P-loop NTPase [Microbacterium halimionae]MBA8816615.1 MinD-like ATPase involved in chromosome partitioning or flagellar assembly [Microbacterium halimionae]NII95198.1 MinD-like ATPase involved in chromosome partitioning or flagellar assembly [Microbacterium halimionae]